MEDPDRQGHPQAGCVCQPRHALLAICILRSAFFSFSNHAAQGAKPEIRFVKGNASVRKPKKKLWKIQDHRDHKVSR